MTGASVNTEPKPFASLSSGLLARKGAARPAMRPQGFGQAGAGLEDLGWNDMGFEPPKPVDPAVLDCEADDSGDEIVASHPHKLAGLTPVDSPVHGQQAEIAGRFSAFAPDASNEEDEEVDETAELYDSATRIETDTDSDAEAEGGVEADAEDNVDKIADLVPAPPVAVAVVKTAQSAKKAAVPSERQEATVSKIRQSPAAPQGRAAPEGRTAPQGRAAAGSKAKTAFTLRLDSNRHLKLRLACAVSGQSAQMLVTQALDGLLAQMPELEAMAGKAKSKG